MVLLLAIYFYIFKCLFLYCVLGRFIDILFRLILSSSFVLLRILICFIILVCRLIFRSKYSSSLQFTYFFQSRSFPGPSTQSSGEISSKTFIRGLEFLSCNNNKCTALLTSFFQTNLDPPASPSTQFRIDLDNCH